MTANMENLPLQYVTDPEGNKTAVVVPIAQWNQLMEELRALQEHTTLTERLTSSMGQVVQMKEGKLPKRTLHSFLDEG